MPSQFMSPGMHDVGVGVTALVLALAAQIEMSRTIHSLPHQPPWPRNCTLVVPAGIGQGEDRLLAGGPCRKSGKGREQSRDRKGRREAPGSVVHGSSNEKARRREPPGPRWSD